MERTMNRSQLIITDKPKEPMSSHPVVMALTESFKSSTIEQKQSLKLRKISQVLGWRNRYSQMEYYPVEILTHQNQIGQEEVATLFQFRVKQVQRGETENTYGTGGTVWPASLVLMKYLEKIVTSRDERLWKLIGKRPGDSLNIVELGAGTGVASIAAGVLFPNSSIICTDGEERVVGLADENIRLNSCKSIQGERGYVVGSSVIYPRKYSWGDGTIMKELTCCCKDSLLSVWPSPSFDLVIFSDCVLPKLFPIGALIDALDECMASSTVAYCANEKRYFADYDPKQYFIQHAAQKGLTVRVIPMAAQHPSYSVEDIEIWEITKQDCNVV